MPLFGRRKAEPVTSSPVDHAPVVEQTDSPAGDLACEHPYCNRHDGVRCAYQDRRGNACQSQWCPDHYQVVSGAIYCRRHVSVARALLAHKDSAYAVAPDITNRAPSLCEWVAGAIDERVMGVLTAASAALPGSRILTEQLELVLEGSPRLRFWERSWKLADHTGPLAKLAIRVAEENDGEVMALVGREVLAAVVPPWVDRSATDEVSREGFYMGIVHTLSRGLDEYLRTNDAATRGVLPG